MESGYGTLRSVVSPQQGENRACPISCDLREIASDMRSEGCHDSARVLWQAAGELESHAALGFTRTDAEYRRILDLYHAAVGQRNALEAEGVAMREELLALRGEVSRLRALAGEVTHHGVDWGAIRLANRVQS